MSAARRAPRGDTFVERLQARVSQLIRIRPIGDAAGDDAATVLGRVEPKAARGDVDGVLADLQRLPAEMRAPANDWIARAKARQAALAAARSFDANAVAASRRNRCSRNDAGLSLYLALVAVAALAAGWFIDQPGGVEIAWLDHRISTSVAVLAGVMLAFVALLVVAWWLFITVVRSPGRVRQRVKTRRLRNGHRAITRGLIAIGAGDVDAAARYAAEARKLVADEPLTLLLGAQSAQMSGDRAAAEKIVHVHDRAS